MASLFTIKNSLKEQSENDLVKREKLALTSKFETEKQKNSNKRSIWSKILDIFIWGILMYFAGFFSVIFNNYVRQEAFSLLGDSVYSIMFFLIVAYWRIIVIENCEEKLRQALSPSWREAARTFRLLLYVILVWLVLVFVRGLLLPQFLKIDFSFLDTLLGYLFYSFPFLLCIFSLIVYIPSGQYLSLQRLEVKERKKVADALTVVTPALGFPWLIAVSLVLLLAKIQVEPYWIIYVVFISIYVALYVIFVDLPYSVSVREIKKQKLDELEKARNELLEKLRKIGNDKQKSLLKKIVFESKIARLDREKQEVKSQSVHPYKVIIPFASFFLGIFGALFIEFIKNILQLE